MLVIVLLFNSVLLRGQSSSSNQSDEEQITENYNLRVTEYLNENGALFTLNFENRTNLKETFIDAEVSILMADEFGNNYSQYLYKVDITELDQLLDDNYIQFDGEDYVIVNNEATVKFLPSDITPGFYTFKVALSHNKLGTIYSNSIALNLPLILKDDNRKTIYLRGAIDQKVYGEIELIIDENNGVVGRFTNIVTKKIIHLTGKYIQGFFGVDTLNLKEYEYNEKLTGYFEGTLTDGIYEGYWLNPKRTARVSFVLTNR